MADKPVERRRIFLELFDYSNVFTDGDFYREAERCAGLAGFKDPAKMAPKLLSEVEIIGELREIERTGQTRRQKRLDLADNTLLGFIKDKEEKTENRIKAIRTMYQRDGGYAPTQHQVENRSLEIKVSLQGNIKEGRIGAINADCDDS